MLERNRGRHGGRNGFIDILRLIFAVLILMYHFYSDGAKHFYSGYLGVEFFAILSGALLFAGWFRKQFAENDIGCRLDYFKNYMKRRYASFFMYTAGPFVATFVVTRVWFGGVNSLATFCDTMSRDIWDLLLVTMTGINQGNSFLTTVAWTMMSMLIAEFCVLGCMALFERQYLNFFMHLSIIAGFGFWANADMSAIGVHTFFTSGTLRIYILTCVGYYVYWLSQKIRRISFTTVGECLLTVSEMTGYCGGLLIACLRRTLYYNFCFILLIAVSLAISLSERSYSVKVIPEGRITRFCAEFSLYLYVTQLTVLRFFRALYPDVNDLYRQKFVFIPVAVVVALSFMYLTRGAIKLFNVAKRRLKPVLICEKNLDD